MLYGARDPHQVNGNREQIIQLTEPTTIMAFPETIPVWTCLLSELVVLQLSSRLEVMQSSKRL